MADPEAVILSTMESLDRWLLKKADPWENSYERLGSLVVGMAEFGEENKERILSVMAGIVDHEKNMDRWDDTSSYSSEENLYRFIVTVMNLGRKGRMNKLQSLVVGMAEFYADTNNKEKLFSLLIMVACPGQKMHMNKKFRILAGITDIWVDDAKEIDRLLYGIAYNRDHYAPAIYEKTLYDLVVEMATNHVWKLNKEKLYAWLAHWVPCWTKEHWLFRFLFNIARFDDDNTESTKAIVERARNELRLILNFITDHSKLEDQAMHCFISDAAEMANFAHRLIHLKESDPFILLYQMFIFQVQDFISEAADQFSEKMAFVLDRLQETKECMLEFGDEKKVVGAQLHDAGEGSKYVVGLDHDINLLLHKEDFRSNIIFIKGMIGIGKTTLARELYNRAIVDGRFERCAWVRVSGKYSRRQIIFDILQVVAEIDKRDASFENMDNESLRDMVRQHLEGKRYFVVLDGWDEADLYYVVQAFPKDKGSRLLFTTRNTGIIIDNRTDYNHDMQFLDDGESLKLLLNTVFLGATDKKFPKEFEQKVRGMLRKCNGLPLAIIEVGRQWANKRQSGIAWEEILNEAPSLSETMLALESTYHRFVSGLKWCIMHLAFFKEGAAIKVARGARILIVVGVDLSGWLFRLSDESIIQVKDMDNNGRRTFTINAVHHTLSIQKAKDELSFEIIENNGNHRPSHKARHRAICCSREKFPSCSMSRDKKLVSLFFRGGGYFDASPSYWEQFEQLKILDMEDFGLKILPDAIGTLVELRYLGLRNNYLQELPRSLARLKKLEVLDITLNFMVLVPDIIWDMDSLCYVCMSDIICDKPLRIDALKKLEILNFVSIDSWTYEMSELKKTNLFLLGVEEIDKNSDVRRLFVSLVELRDLYYLILRGFRFRSMPSLDELSILQGLRKLKLEGHLTKLPSVNNFPFGIRHLTLVNSCLDEDPMPILEKLFTLHSLKLENAYTGQLMVISPYELPHLECLVIGESWHLRNVQVAKGAMHQLRELEIYSCPYLETLPEEILSIDTLEKLKIVTTKKIAMKIRESAAFLSNISKVDVQP